MICHYSECHYVKCRILFIIVLNVIILSVVMFNVVMLSVAAATVPLKYIAEMIKIFAFLQHLKKEHFVSNLGLGGKSCGLGVDLAYLTGLLVGHLADKLIL